MPNRALILAVSHYPAAGGLYNYDLHSVPGAARDFYCWLRKIDRVKPDSFFICHDGIDLPKDQPVSVPGKNGQPVKLLYGTSAAEMRAAVKALLDVGADQTDELWVYCAGHGYSYNENPNDCGVGYLIASEFADVGAGGPASINLSALQQFLRTRLSGNRHFHFIDACRNAFDVNAIDPPISIGIGRAPSNNTQARLFRMYSAPPGDQAPADNGFTSALMDGLHGKGRSKVMSPEGELWVTFSRLGRYVRQRLNRPLESVNEIDDQIVQIVPTAQVCSIEIRNAKSHGGYTLQIDHDGYTRQLNFDQSVFEIPIDPSERPYSFSLTQKGVQFVRIEPQENVAIDMFDSCKLVFEVRELPPAPAGMAAAASQNADTITTIAISSDGVLSDARGNASLPAQDPPATADTPPRRMVNLRVRDDFLLKGPSTGPGRLVLVDNRQVLVSNEETQSVEVVPGEHSITLLEDGKQVWQGLMQAVPGVDNYVDIGEPARRPFQIELLQDQSGFRTPTLAHAIGPTGDFDANLWLAWLAVAWLRPTSAGAPELVPFANGFGSKPTLQPGGSALVLLVADDVGAPDAMLGSPQTPAWTALTPHPVLDGLYYGVFYQQPGATNFLSCRMADGACLTYATALRPDWITAVTLSKGTTMRLQQFELPPDGKEAGWAAPQMNDLQMTRLLSSAQALFIRKEKIIGEGLLSAEAWQALLQGTWRNRQFAALCALQARGSNQPAILRALLELYPVGDVAGLGCDLDLLQVPSPPGKPALPLLLESLLLRPSIDTPQGLPAGLIDYHGLWLSWYGVSAAAAAPDTVLNA